MDAYNQGMTFDELMRHFKTQVAVANKLGIGQPSVSLWKKKGGIPQLRQYQIERVTAGQLKADTQESA